MKYLKIVILSIFTLTAVGCQSKKPSGSLTSNTPHGQDTTVPLVTKPAENLNGADTTLQFHQGSQTWSVRIPRRSLDYFDGFQALLDTLHSPTDSGSTELTADLTGEGTPQRCVSNWKLTDSGAMLRHFVFSRQGMIWSDSGAFSDEYASQELWEEDSSYFRLKPYSTIYVAQKELGRFIGDSVNQTILEDVMMRGNLTMHHSLDYWQKHLSHFKGRVIWQLGMDPDRYIWDEELHRFILLYAP